MICPICNKEIPNDSVFCPECGEKIPEQGQNQKVGIFCPECGTGNVANARFCEKCGAPLFQSNIQEVSKQKEIRQPEDKKPGGEKAFLIAGLFLLLFAIIVGGAFAAYNFIGRSEREVVQRSDTDSSGTIESDSTEKESKEEKTEAETKAEAKSGTETKTEEDSEEEEEEKYDPKEGGIHRYEYVISDCTWEQAYSECLKKGGYLVHINSREEYNYILNEITKKQLDRIHFRIGAKRNTNSKDYYWVNEENQLYRDKVNSPAYWCSSEWMTAEPSFEDNGTMEMYLDIFYYQGMNQWVWNDVPNDIVAVVPAYAGKLGYICEYEDE